MKSFAFHFWCERGWRCLLTRRAFVTRRVGRDSTGWSRPTPPKVSVTAVALIPAAVTRSRMAGATSLRSEWTTAESNSAHFPPRDILSDANFVPHEQVTLVD